MKKVILLNVVVFLMVFGAMETKAAEIEIIHVSPYGYTYGVVLGQVSGVTPSDYYVWVYIYVPPYGWWTKPSYVAPRTTIESGGSWMCDITTGGTDQYAVKIAAFLAPDGDILPKIGGAQCLPSSLYQDYPYAETIRYNKISFSGYDWLVKRSHARVGPGPNYFSDSNDNVWVDANDHLHLAIIKEGEDWYCSEVIADFIGGYGTYIFTVKGRVDLLDENIVLGLFTWEDCAPEYYYQEIDIEFAKWGYPENDNAQYVVQPYYEIGNMHRFNVDCSTQDTTTNIFTWSRDKITFRSYYGDFSLVLTAEDMITSWFYTRSSNIPPEGAENPRINFWLMSGLAPTDGNDAEIVIKSFQYIPDITAEIDFIDFARFALYWLETECGACGGADLDSDEDVDPNDLKKLIENWLECSFLQ